MRRLVFLFFLLPYSLFAQNGVVTGRVYNEVNNEGVPFANVYIEGTTVGTTTDFDGKFKLENLEPGFVVLTASSIGFKAGTSSDVLITNAKPAYVEIGIGESSTQLEEVVIEASPFNEKEESPVSMRTIGVAEIERNPGGNRDISKVIQSFPGVASTPAFRNDIIIRGGAPNENRFYLDGIEVPNINHFATQGASGGPVGIINVNLIREVDFYSGAFPANRGNALSSVMEFKQMEGNKDKMRFRGTLGSSDLGLTIDGPIGEKTSYMLSVRRSYLQFLFSILELPFLPIYNDYQLKVTHKIDQKNEISIISLGALDNFELNTDANETESQRYILRNLPVNEQWNYTIGAVYKHYSKNSFQTLALSRNMLNNRSVKYENNIEAPQNLILDYNSREAENKLRFESTGRQGDWKTNYGVNFESARYTNETFNRIFIPETPLGPSGLDTIDFSSEIEFLKFGLFGQVSRTLGSWTLSVGARMDANSYSASMANPLNQFSPRFSMSYAVNEQWSINANLGRYYQLPAYTVLGYRVNDVLVNKENDLKYIQGDHAVAGLEYRPRASAKITLEGFYKNYRNYPFSVTQQISLANMGADFGVIGNEEVTSTSEGRAYGMEFLAQQKLFKGFYTILAYTLVRSEFENATDGEFIPSAWDSEHLITFTAGKKFKGNWEIGARWRYVHGRPYTPYLLDESSYRRNWDIRGVGILDYSQINSLRLAPFHQLDLRVDKVFYAKNFSLNLYFDIQNAYNFKAEGQPFLNIVEDANTNPIVLNPGDNYFDQRYQTKLVDSQDGTVLPTLGIIFDF
jgi:outer membrane receptor for ferrienterochelin and colicin